jgi:thiol-disulfide isomerase/thioredoxin
MVSICLALVLSSCSAGGPPGAFTRLDERMPTLSGSTLTGGTFGPAQYRGNVVVINFWASWCAPCLREMPALQSLFSQVGGQGVTFVGINENDNAGAARSYLAKVGVKYPSLTDRSSLAHAFHIPYLPATVVVSQQGIERFRAVGEQNESFLLGMIKILDPQLDTTD